MYNSVPIAIGRANKVLKEYLLKGYATNHRIERIENDVFSLKKKVDEFDLIIKTSLPPHEGIFYDGQIFDAHLFVSNLIKSANQSIVLIDNYIDESVLLQLTKRNLKVEATIFTLVTLITMIAPRTLTLVTLELILIKL